MGIIRDFFKYEQKNYEQFCRLKELAGKDTKPVHIFTYHSGEFVGRPISYDSDFIAAEDFDGDNDLNEEYIIFRREDGKQIKVYYNSFCGWEYQEDYLRRKRDKLVMDNITGEWEYSDGRKITITAIDPDHVVFVDEEGSQHDLYREDDGQFYDGLDDEYYRLDDLDCRVYGE